MVRVDRIHPASLTDQQLDVAVVIDVLRATSTAIVLLARGVPSVRMVATPEDLHDLAPAPSRPYLVFSELDESRSSRLECVDNSPALAAELRLEGRTPVLVTTNGTRAVAAAMVRARRVYVASFLNLSSTAEHLLAGADRVTLLPAGDFAGRDVRTEDERCADGLEQLLLGGAPDLASLVAHCRADARVKRRLARNPDLARDVDLSLAVDRYGIIATVVPPAGGPGADLIQLG